MKVCPKCGNSYTDETLSFCLSDGTSLEFQFDHEKTEVLPKLVINVDPSDSQSNQTKETNLPTEQTYISSDRAAPKPGVSSLWVFATIGLAGLLLIGIFSVWLFSDSLFRAQKVVEDTNSHTNSQDDLPDNRTPANRTDQKIGAANDPKENIQQPTRSTPEKTVPPADDTYRVVGVKNNDVLYIRPAAGNLKSIVGKIPPDGVGIKVTGPGKKIGKSVWVPISYNGLKGWVNRRFIGK